MRETDDPDDSVPHHDSLSPLPRAAETGKHYPAAGRVAAGE